MHSRAGESFKRLCTSVIWTDEGEQPATELDSQVVQLISKLELKASDGKELGSEEGVCSSPPTRPVTKNGLCSVLTAEIWGAGACAGGPAWISGYLPPSEGCSPDMKGTQPRPRLQVTVPADGPGDGPGRLHRGVDSRGRAQMKAGRSPQTFGSSKSGFEIVSTTLNNIDDDCDSCPERAWHASTVI